MTTEINAAAGAAVEVSAPVEIANPAEVAPAADPVPEHERTIKKLERRIGNITRSRYEADARAQQAEERVARIEAMLQERQKQADPTQGEKEPDPQEIEHRIGKRAEELATIKDTNARSNKIAAEGLKAYGDDFKASVTVVQEEAGPLYQRNGLPTALGEAILDADNPAALLHHLGQNPEEAEALQGLSAAALGRRIARLEAQITAAPKPSKVPLPLEPVKGAAGGTPSPDSPDYTAWRIKKLRGG